MKRNGLMEIQARVLAWPLMIVVKYTDKNY